MNKHFRVSGSTFSKLEELGVRASAVLRRAGLPQGFIDQPRVLLNTEELFALWRAVGEVTPNPAIGLQLGTESKTERFHPIGLAALSSENLGAAIDQMARYKQLTCPEEILQEKDDEEWSIQFRWLLADEVEPPVLIECCFAWVLSTARHGTGTRLSPLRVEFVQLRSHVKTIERHFGCPVVCGAPRNTIVFRASDAQRPFVTRNAELLGMLAPQFEEDLKQQSGNENFAKRVRGAVQQKLTGRRPTIEDIADALHVSSRTLQRRLQDEGSSFQRVLEEARHQLARHYLNNSVLELNEAAYLLGYEDANSFVRAFRTWEGVPPARWREKHRARAAS
ncbi:MAG: AraC family transcriptional regulator [Acidobacteria bacterium]|nr:MAG: AraC family transcriptional regulator [Acidobacteria bacterium 13_1_40CM_4_58_4]PYT58059.1 MAG: AraC family transcriptional regulator [Acidobacteriota bacterium]